MRTTPSHLPFAAASLLCLLALACQTPAPPAAAPQDQAAGPAADTRSSRHASRAPAADTPGVFDFYLLNLSWSPEFCSTHPGKPECAAHPGFVLHGLWPQNTGGTYPENCSRAPGPSNPSSYRDIFPDAGLLQHEWSTHGTCSGLAPDAYLALARRAITSVTVPSTFNQTKSFSLTPDAILSQFAASNSAIPRTSLALSCGNNLLTAVEVCLDKNLHAVSCSGVRTCRAQTVRVVPRGSPN